MDTPSDVNFSADVPSVVSRGRGQAGREVVEWCLPVGIALLAVGLTVLGYYWLLYDTTVVEYVGVGTPQERRVNNLGLVSSRLAGMIGGGVLATIGAVFCVRRRAG